MINNKIELLRKHFIQHGIDGYLVPSNDEFLNEYTPDCLNRLAWLTGFESSNAVALITKDKNYMFTDGRYIEAAEKKLKGEFEILNIYQHSVWDLIDKLNVNAAIAPELFIKDDKMKNIKFVTELVDLIWKREKQTPDAKYFYYEEKYTGSSFADKAAKVCKVMQENGADYMIITQPDLICWLTNLRGRDQEFTPLVLSYAILDKDGNLELFLFNDNAQIDAVKHITYKKFDEFQQKISELDKILIDPATTNLSVINIASQKAIWANNPIIELRTIKNHIEIKNAKKIHIIDSIAMCKFLKTSFQGMMEEEVKQLSYKIRAQSDLFFSPSFETIAGFAGNGSVIHYHIRPDTNKKIEGNSLLLVDSGGQYFGGTTDITRTIAIGTPTKEQIFAYTIVLKAHLALSNAVFKKGTKGSELDKIVRTIMRKHNMDYDHGTGHGVGNFLGVHESPPRISAKATNKIEAGMIISNEPGYYKKGEFGIRIENLCLVKEISEDTLAMEDLTLVPYEDKLIDLSLLTDTEKQYLSNYYNKIQNQVLPYIQ